MEESVARKNFNSDNKKGRKYSRRTKYLATCTHPDCNISAHVCSQMGQEHLSFQCLKVCLALILLILKNVKTCLRQFVEMEKNI